VAEQREGALSVYRVLDLADHKGAYCTKLLADLGADVIKIEPPHGDSDRSIPPFVDDLPHLEKSLYFLYRHANKRGITLDLETSDGKAIFKKLVETADILKAPYTIEDPQLKWRDAITEIDHPVVGKKIYPGIPFKFSEMPLPQSTPAPILGQHTDEICRELLKMSEEEIRRLKEEGVLESTSV
jgi:crotonobetainyl-CoA:carnitine CoA-transferase CaiB-like acyl-CoA transferase